MEQCVPRKTPAEPNVYFTKDDCPTAAMEIDLMKKYPYRETVGRLLYISITTRPDIAPAVSAVGRYAQNPGLVHWNAVLHIVQYLKGTVDYALTLGGTSNTLTISAYADADWAGNIDDRKSRTGYLLLLGITPVIWCSKLQISVSLSSTEAEYISLSTATQEVLWLRTFLHELGYPQLSSSIIYEDNKSCIDIATNNRFNARTKHIALRHHFIKDHVKSKEIHLQRIRTTAMVTDMFTKPLAYPLIKSISR